MIFTCCSIIFEKRQYQCIVVHIIVNAMSCLKNYKGPSVLVMKRKSMQAARSKGGTYQTLHPILEKKTLLPLPSTPFAKPAQCNTKRYPLDFVNPSNIRTFMTYHCYLNTPNLYSSRRPKVEPHHECMVLGQDWSELSNKFIHVALHVTCSQLCHERVAVWAEIQRQLQMSAQTKLVPCTPLSLFACD